MKTVKPHIVIDARLYGPEHHTGIGRYTKNLLLALKDLPHFEKYNFTLLVYPELLKTIKRDLGDNFNYLTTDIRHYSLSEQLLLPALLRKLHPDLVHFTHFNKPLFYFGPTLVTIHDLIKHFYRGKETTTRQPGIYWLKYLGYLILTTWIIKTNRIVVPSNFWRDYIISKFHLNPNRITTTYEAIDPNFLSGKTILISKNFSNYIIYTGNLYPHKNIRIILKALKSLPEIRLKIICARNLFHDRLNHLISSIGVKSQVDYLGFVKDKNFGPIYSKALCLVHPAFMEGFSLTGLEAMALNCPVISSNASCLPEIYQTAVLYFDPNDSDSLVNKILELKNSPALRMKLINLGKKHILKYSWEKTANLTLNSYQSALNEK